MIVVIDYGMGNIGSIINMVKKAGGEAIAASDKKTIEQAEKIILPGVGAFDNGMTQLNSLGLIEILNNSVIKKHVPILGICLGMQLLTKTSEEGALPGLGWLDATTVKFKFDAHNSSLKIPHMGWNLVTLKKNGPLFKEMYDEPCFYFVHSYYVKCNDENDVLTTTQYGFDFTSSIQRGNIFATQFHPEKSHKYGFKIINNFITLV